MSIDKWTDNSSGGGSGTGGVTEVKHDASLTGKGTATDPLKVKDYNKKLEEVQTDESTLTGKGTSTDKLRIKSIKHDTTLQGLGTSSSKLKVKDYNKLLQDVKTDNDTLQGAGLTTDKLRLKKVYADTNSIEGLGTSSDKLKVKDYNKLLQEVKTDNDTLQGKGTNSDKLRIKKIYADNDTLQGIGTSGDKIRLKEVKTDGTTIKGKGISSDKLEVIKRDFKTSNNITTSGTTLQLHSFNTLNLPFNQDSDLNLPNPQTEGDVIMVETRRHIKVTIHYDSVWRDNDTLVLEFPYIVVLFVHHQNGGKWFPIIINNSGDGVRSVGSDYTIPNNTLHKIVRAEAIGTNTIVTLPSETVGQRVKVVAYCQGGYYVMVKWGSVEWKLYHDWSMEFTSNGSVWYVTEKHTPLIKQLYSTNFFVSSNVERALLYNESLPNRGNNVMWRDNRDLIKPITGVGVQQKALWMQRLNNTYIDSVNLYHRSFILATWIKITDTSSQDNYIWSVRSSRGNKKTLHIGYHSDTNFRIGFYGADANFNLSSPYKLSNIRNRFAHIAVYHNTTNKHTELWINGAKQGELAHPAQYEGGLDYLFGKWGTPTMGGVTSQFRIIVSYQNRNLTFVNMGQLYRYEQGLMYE